MRTNIRFALVALLALPLAAAETTRMQTASATVKVEGTSTMHAWSVGGSTIQGFVEIPVALADGSSGEWVGKVRPATKITIPVASLDSEHKKMTSLMRDALQAEKAPNIEYQLTEVVGQKAAGGTVELATRGTLTIAGKTRPLEMPVQVRRAGGGQIVIRGTAPVKMTDFGIKPPTAMLGTIKTGDAVTVSFEWTVTGPAAAASGAMATGAK